MTSPRGIPPFVRRNTFFLAVAAALILGGYLGFVFSGLYHGQTSAQQPLPSAGLQPSPSMNTGDSVRELERMARENPGSAEAWIRLGDALYDAGSPAQSIEAYRKALAITPDNAEVWNDMGVMQRSNAQPKQALESFDRAIQLAPDLEPPRFNKGPLCCSRISRTPQALWRHGKSCSNTTLRPQRPQDGRSESWWRG